MESYKMVPTEFLKGLAEAVKDNPFYRESVQWFVEEGTDVPMESMPYVSKEDIVKSMDLGNGIDYALPQPFVNTVYDKLGYNLRPDFVFDCNNWFIVPITKTGRIMLPVIYKIVLEQEVPKLLKKYLER